MIMCLAIPARILKVEGEEIVADIFGEEIKAKRGFVSPSKGDYVIIQQGVVTEILEKKAAEESLSAWRNILNQSK